MKYDFSSLIDRHGMDSIAVDSWGEIPGMAPNAPDEGFDRIPMWVADMDRPHHRMAEPPQWRRGPAP